MEPVVSALGGALANIDHEILIVDDDSPDGTWRRAEAVATANPRVRVIRRTASPGLAASVIDRFTRSLSKQLLVAAIAILAFVQTAVAAGGPISDEFNTTPLNTSLWTVVNPVGDGSVSLNGTQAQLSLPAGSEHDIWKTGNRSLRLMQAMGDIDFKVEVKFDSTVNQGSQMQGLIVEQDSSKYLRLEQYFDGTNVHLFVAKFVNGQPTVQLDTTLSGGTFAPFWLRVQRTGNTWTYTWSKDGTNYSTATTFTFSMVVNRIGPHAGNCCSTTSPSFTASIDYFRNIGPMISGLTVSPTANSATVSWTTSVPANGRLDFGLSSFYGNTLTAPALVTSHSLTATGLSCNTPYHYQVTSVAANGNTAQSADAVFTTGSCSGATGPPVSDEFNDSTLNNSLWTIGNPVGDGAVSFNGTEVRLSLPAGSEHDVWTSGNRSLRLMQAVADVDFKVEVKFDSAVSQGAQMQGLIVEQDGNTYLRFDQYFDGTNVHLFVAKFVSGKPTVQSNTTLSGSTFSPFWLRVQRTGSNWTYTWSKDGTTFNIATTFAFSMVANRIGPFVGNCCGSSSPTFNSAIDYFRNIGPVISTVTASPSTNSATISWVTDRPATSNVSFGLTAAYGSSIGTGSMTTNHSIDLLGLSCNTIYHYRVSSTDAAGATSSGTDETFSTTACVGAPPVISNINVVPSQTSASISWTTDKSSDSRVDYGLTSNYGSAVSNSSLVTSHTLGINGLTCNVGYHFRVSSTDQFGNLGVSPDQTFTTTACATGNAPASDDFSSGALNSRWVISNPVGDGTVSVSGGRLRMSIPGGVDHDVWTNGNRSLNVMQAIGNVDFQVVAKFDSPPASSAQMQGILVQQDSATFVRFDIYRDCIYTHIFGASFTNGQPTVRYNITLDSSARPVTSATNRAGTMSPVWVRVTRTGDTWTESWSLDGTNFTSAPSFTFPMSATKAGPFVGNCCSTKSPAFTSSVDYFFNTASPIAPEDGGAADIPLMTPFRARAPITGPAPVIDVWYGPNQSFGQNGAPQQWVNVLGTVYGQNPISSLSYTLNGGALQPLAMGQQYPRLVEIGDFNVEIDRANLNNGANSVVITAMDNAGNQTTQTVTVNYVRGRTWPLPYSVDWSTVTNISDVAQIVDGKWQLQPDGSVRTMQVGYDRLIAIGDMNTWTNYEVTAEITINTFDCMDFGIGIVTGWKGHSTVQFGKVLPDQPRTGHVFTGLGWWTNEVRGVPRGTSAAEEIYNNTVLHPENVLAAKIRFLTLGTKYIYKFRVDPDTASTSLYSLKIWPAGTPEPLLWDLQAVGELNQGSILLASHKGDVSFGRVTIVPVP